MSKIFSSIGCFESMKNKYIPYERLLNVEQGCLVFFVGLSHKLGKDGTVLEAFCESTSSGKIIGNILEKSNGISIYKTNLVKGVPLDEKNKIRYPNVDEKKEGLNVLMKEIDEYEPRLVFLFGRQVSDFVIKEMKLKENNENEYLYKNTKILSVDHPSYIAVYKRNLVADYVSDILNKINPLFKKDLCGFYGYRLIVS